MKKFITIAKEVLKADKDIYIVGLVIICAFAAAAFLWQPKEPGMWEICHDCDVTNPPTFSDDFEAK